LNNHDLTRLDKELSHLSLDIEDTSLRTDEEVAVGVTVCLVGHVGVEHVHVESDTLAQVWVTAAGQCMKAVCEIDMIIVCWKWKR